MLSAVPLEPGRRDEALSTLPACAGVAQILGAEGKSLVIAPAANVRRWVAGRLGAGPPPKPGTRPPVDLTPVAAEVRFATTTSPFHQKLTFERLMARHVPPAARRDLKPPAWLHLDPRERFPRVTVRPHGPALEDAYGPFRDRAAAATAVAALHKRFPLRACDAAFEPHPTLALGEACLYAQVRTCAAPCLQRTTEDDYRALAQAASGFLSSASARPEDAAAWCPGWVGPAGGAALVVERGRSGLELYPVAGGAVLEASAACVAPGDAQAAAAALRWGKAEGAPDDWPWLAAWLQAPRRTGRWLPVADGVPNDGREMMVI